MTKEELRKQWREEIKQYPEMDALGSADWWISKLDTYADAKLEEVAGKIEKLEDTMHSQHALEENGINHGLQTASSLVREAKSK